MKLQKLIYNYINEKRTLVFLFFLVTLLDSFFALLTILALAPVIQFMTSDFLSMQTGTLKYYFDFIDYIGIEFNLINSLLIFLSLTILSSVLNIGLFFISKINGFSINYHLTSWAIYRYYDQGLTFINSQSFGVIQNTFSKEITKVTDAIFSVLQLLSVIIFSFLMLSFSLTLSLRMSVIILASFFIIAILISRLGKKISYLSSLTLNSANIVSQKLYTPLMNAKNILAFGRAKWALISYKDAFYTHFRDAIKSQTLAFFVPEFFKTFSILTAVLALLYALSQGESITLLIVTLAVFIRLLPKIANLTDAYSMIKDATPSIIQYSRLFPQDDNKTKSTKRKIDNFSSSLLFDNVSFSYPTRKGIIKNLNIEIKKNSFVSFVGSSGSGKTTCADLLMGLYSPEKGSIIIDGHPLVNIDLQSYLDRVGYVQQDSVLLDGSIRENLLWANPIATEGDMWESLKLVSIDKFVKSLPNKLDNLVGDRGVSISGGQKQRIALALALIRNPDILILDEATSSLDYESEKIIRNSLESLSHKLTIISVTHRPSMAEHSDMIYVFDKGSVVESGNYKSLIENKGIFLNLMSGDS